MNTISVVPSHDRYQPSHCHITTTKGIYNLPLDEILFIESQQKKSMVHTKNGVLPLSLPLYRVKKALPASFFLQTHRSFLVNLNNISYIDKQKDPWTIHFFSTEKQAYISRSFRHQIMDAVILSD